MSKADLDHNLDLDSQQDYGQEPGQDNDNNVIIVLPQEEGEREAKGCERMNTAGSGSAARRVNSPAREASASDKDADSLLEIKQTLATVVSAMAGMAKEINALKEKDAIQVPL